jgi:hypothetical protein
MPISVKGFAGPIRTRSEITFDPVLGDGVMEWWKGPKQAILGMARYFKEQGYRCTARSAGPLWEFQIFIGKSDSDEAAQDRWTFDKDFPQISIFALPWVAAEAAKYVSKAQYRKDLEDAVKNGKDNPLDVTQFPLSIGVYEDLSRGTEAYEVERVILRRTRTYSFTFPDKIVLQPLPVVYSEKTLVATFKIPASIQAQMPDPPADVTLTPSGTRWAWKTRHDSCDEIPYLNKFQEIKEWVFAAWSTHLYAVL